MNNEHHFPMFSQAGLCEGYENPDIWFPEPTKPHQTNHYQSRDSMYARSVCNVCVVNAECYDYSIKYSGLYGIWAGLDPRQRSDIQVQKGIDTIELRETLPKFYEHSAGSSKPTTEEETYG